MFSILFFSGFLVAISQLKIPPVMDMVSETLQVSITKSSWLMSVFTLAGIFLAIPGAAIMNKVGPKKLLLSLMAALALGNLIGFFTDNYYILLISRGIEGIAYAMMIMVGVVLINTWFSEGGAGSAIGIFNTATAVGAFVMMNLAIPIVLRWGLKSLWLFTAGSSIILCILIARHIESPSLKDERALHNQVSLVEAAKNCQVWILSLMMFCVAFSLFTYITTYPQLFNVYYHLNPVQANFYASLNGLFGIVFCIMCGVIVDKMHNPLVLCFFGFLGLAVTGFIVDLLSGSTFVLHTLLSGFFSGFVITSIFIIAPALARKPIFVGYTIAFVDLLYYLGVFACTPLILGAVAALGWGGAKYILVLVSLIGAGFSVALMLMQKQGLATPEISD